MSAAASSGEWQSGWRIVAAAAIGNSVGISLLFYTYTLFVLPMAQDLHLTRAQGGQIQSALAAAAIGAPLLGRLVDRYSFHLLFLLCTLGIAGIEIAFWAGASGFWSLFFGTMILGFIGGGSSTVVITRPLNAHFSKHRGLALGLVGTGISLTTIVASPLLHEVIANYGWRSGFLALALVALLVGLPFALLLMPRSAAVPAAAERTGSSDRSHLHERDFWLIVAANFCVAMATSMAVGQLSPMLQERGLSAGEAALGVSVFAAGQFIGKLGGGWLLDRFEPRIVAAALNVLPTLGFVLLLTQHGAFMPLMIAAALIGILQGADIDVFAYFVAHRFGMARYGTVFGTMHGIGWIGIALALTGAGWSFDRFHGFWAAQVAGIVLLLTTALLIVRVRVPRAGPAELPVPPDAVP